MELFSIRYKRAKVTFKRNSFIYFLLFGGARVWTHGFTQAKQALNGLSHTSSSSFIIIIIIFCSTGVWTQGLHLGHSTSPFLCWVFFKIGSHRPICSGWLWAMILQISASWVVRITGMSHRRPASFIFLMDIPCGKQISKIVSVPSHSLFLVLTPSWNSFPGV
jgi:hypothetical protein